MIRLWDAPVHTPGCAGARERGEPEITVRRGEVAAWVRGFAAAVAEAKDELTALDAAIGDADHGINMDRGMRAVVAEARRGRAGGRRRP